MSNQQVIAQKASQHYFPSSDEINRRIPYPFTESNSTYFVTVPTGFLETGNYNGTEFWQPPQNQLNPLNDISSLHNNISCITGDKHFNYIQPTITLPNDTDLRSDSTLEQVQAQLQLAYTYERTQKHRAASKVIFRYIEFNFSISNLTAVNFILKTADLNQLSKWSIAGLVRFTASAKAHLPAWASVYRKAKDELASRGDDAEGILAGIKE